jgi:PEP-CTERM motif
MALIVGSAELASESQAVANSVYQSVPFSQNWSNTGLITVNDDWSNVPGIEGYRGDGLTGSTGTDPQTILAFDGGGPVIDVIANQTNPDTLSSGGVAEFEIINPVVALQGSSTADAPFILLYINASGAALPRIRYNVRDLDGSADDAVQQVALQYRLGNTGDFTNVTAGYVSDATVGSSAVQVTSVDVTFADWSNQPQLQIRIITTNAVGNDEWVGIDDIQVTPVGTPYLPGDYNLSGTVDAADYVVWRANIGAATLNNRDPNNMGIVGPADYDFWRAHFGNTYGNGAGAGSGYPQAAVPEPATMVLLIFAVAGWCLRRVRAA